MNYLLIFLLLLTNIEEQSHLFCDFLWSYLMKTVGITHETLSTLLRYMSTVYKRSYTKLSLNLYVST